MAVIILSLIAGLALLVWSADRFVEGSASVARHFGMPPLLIGIVIIGFGTSTPEMIVSTLASLQGNPGVALGNAYGSNITNIALIIGLTALISPIMVHSKVFRRELPILLGITLFAWWQLSDGLISRMDAGLSILLFLGVMAWMIRESFILKEEVNAQISSAPTNEQKTALTIKHGLLWLVVGLLVLIVSSRIFVWGAVELAKHFGVSDLVIGLTVVAIGTSLPELASSLVAARRGEHDMALGNVIGSNLFNTLIVIGIAGLVKPLPVNPEILSRDLPLMTGLTVLLFLFSFGIKKLSRINRMEGAILLAAYVAYSISLFTGSS